MEGIPSSAVCLSPVGLGSGFLLTTSEGVMEAALFFRPWEIGDVCSYRAAASVLYRLAFLPEVTSMWVGRVHANRSRGVGGHRSPPSVLPAPAFGVPGRV